MYQELPGIYCIKNKITGDLYIGSTINLRKRKNRHFSELKLGTHYNTHLQHAVNFYGLENFEFSPLIVCDKNLLVYYEQALIDGLKPKYNARIDATINLGLHHTEETKQKLSKMQVGRKLTHEWQKNRDNSRYAGILENIENKKFPVIPSGKYRVLFQHKHIGCYNTIEEARHAYVSCVQAYVGGY